MRSKTRNGMTAPPALKLLLRGYIIIGFVLLMARFGILTYVPILIFLITIVSISMIFGIGYLLVVSGRPVRASGFTVPNTVLFFVKGVLIIYFLSLLAEFNILPPRIVSMLMVGTAGIMAVFGIAGYVYEVLDRTRPLPAKPRRKPRIQ